MSLRSEAAPHSQTLAVAATKMGTMDNSSSDAVEVTLESRDDLIVKLKKSGATYREIAEVVGISKSQVQRRYFLATGEQFRLDATRHRRACYADLELLLEALRPLVHDDEGLLNMDAVSAFLRANRAKALLLGLELPKVAVPTETPDATEADRNRVIFLAQLSEFKRRQDARWAAGLDIPLPPGMTERVNVNEVASSTSHLGSIWSMALDFPSHDDGVLV
jgi:hypothetical protein